MVPNRLQHPSAWRAADLQHDKSWIVEVSAADRRDALAALAGVVNCDLEEIGATDFPLPELGRKVAALIDEIEGGRGVALLRGAPIEGLSPQEIERLFWGLAVHIGHPERQDAAGKRLHHVHAQVTVADSAEAKRLFTQTNTRGYQTNVELNFHGDGSDALFFLCVRQGKSGGATRLASATSAYNDILATAPDLLETLMKPFQFDTRGEMRDGKTFQESPIFVVHDGLLNILYKRGYIELAQRLEGAAPLTSQQIEAMDALDAAFASPQNCFEFTMQPGDVLVANNYSIVHARTAFEDWAPPAQGRLMLRIWSTLKHNRRRLPSSFQGTREFTESFKRRIALGDSL